MAGWRVEVTGLRETLNALGQIDAKAQKAIQSAMVDLGKEVAAAAGRFVPDSPLGNWGSWNQLAARRSRGAGVLESRDLSFNAATARAGFKVKRNNFRRRGMSAGFGVDVEQRDWAGAIFNIVGDKSRITSPQGAHFVDVINSRFGTARPRSLIGGYYAVDIEARSEQIRDDIASAAIRLGLSDGP